MLLVLLGSELKSSERRESRGGWKWRGLQRGVSTLTQRVGRQEIRVAILDEVILTTTDAPTLLLLESVDGKSEEWSW